MSFPQIVVFLVFVAVIWFVWTHIAADLPDDFLKFVKKQKQKDE